MVYFAKIKSEVYHEHPHGILSDILFRLGDVKSYVEGQDQAKQFIIKLLDSEQYHDALYPISNFLHGDTSEFPYAITTFSNIISTDYPTKTEIISAHITPTTKDCRTRLVANDILPESAACAIEGKACLCCSLYESIEDFFGTASDKPKIACPVCGTLLEGDITWLPVQEANYYSPNHHVGMFPTVECTHCESTIALMPQLIEYNGNHDIYYTGGATYLIDQFKDGYNEASKEILEIFEKKLWPSIKQYVERKLHPKDFMDMDTFLNEKNIHLWTQRDFTAAMAEFFYKHGLKE